MQPESQEQLNSEIHQILLDILPQTQEELQLEIAQIIQQIHRINHLIYQQQNRWLVGLFKSSTKERELIGWLAEVKGILLMLKSDQSSLSMVQRLRINLERNVNNYQYHLGGWFLNSCSYLARSKSTPLKIATGLLLTTLISVATLRISMGYLYNHEIAAPTSQIQGNSLTSKKQDLNSSLVRVKGSSLSQLMTEDPSTKRSNQVIFHGLLYAASAGALGSIASILFRITKFNNESYDDPLIPFFVGVFKPLIGLILGLFVYSLIISQTVIRTDFITSDTVSDMTGVTPNARKHSFIFSIAFIIGFSERLASDLLKSTTSEIDTESDDNKRS